MRSALARPEEPRYCLSVSTDGGESPRYAYVEVRFPDGRGWAARLHTPEGIRTILDDHRRRGQERGEPSGLYFLAPGVIVVGEISRGKFVALVEDLMNDGELESAFVPLG